MHSINLFTSRGQHEVFGQIPTVDIIPESSPFFQDLIIFWRDFRYWSVNLIHCIQLIILFVLFTKCLQSRCNQVRMFNNVVRISGFIQFLSQTSCACSSKSLSKAILNLQLLVKKPAVFRTYSLDSDCIF